MVTHFFYVKRNGALAKLSNENSALPLPDVSQQREQLRAFVDWYNLNRQKNETMIEYYDIRRYLEAHNTTAKIVKSTNKNTKTT